MTLIIATGLGIMLIFLAQGWLLLQLPDQQARLQRRIDDLARRRSLAGPAATPLPGLALPGPSPGTADAPPAVRVGEPVPVLRRPDLDGVVVDFAALRGATTLLLFWSPGCHHCQALLPDIRAWEGRPEGPRLLVVTSGPAAMNREVGLRAPMVPDDDRSIKRAFGVQATPSAVVVDAVGIVASEVARGAGDVRALVADRFAPAARDAN